MPKINQEEFDRVIQLVEEKTCFRYAAGTYDASSAFMVPVAGDGETALSPAIEFTWGQLVAMSELPERPKR